MTVVTVNDLRHFQPVNTDAQPIDPYGPVFPTRYESTDLDSFWHVGCLWVSRWRYEAMTPEMTQAADHFQSELDRLTYFRLSFDTRPWSGGLSGDDGD